MEEANLKELHGSIKNWKSETKHWFAALTAITGENPIRPNHNFDEAIAAWVAWGHEQGMLEY